MTIRPSALRRTTAVPRHGILTLSGYGIRVAMARGHLVIEDGIGATRREARFSRVDRRLQRLVILGHAGQITFDALKWLRDRDVSWIHLDYDGAVIAVAGPSGPDLPQLRRAQATAVLTGAWLPAARFLLTEKLAGQAAILARLPSGALAIPRVDDCRAKLATATTAEDLLRLEAMAARSYWDRWATLPVRFVPGKDGRVPEHWRVFGARLSPLSGSGRRAANPANALINYTYSVLEAEARLTAMAMGCDPGLGIFHADAQSRDSFACDLMEAVRPDVDGCVWDLLRTRVFRRQEFFELGDGGCRLLPPLTHQLARTGPEWRRRLGPITEHVARLLIAHAAPSGPGQKARWRSRTATVPEPITLPTPLTGAHHRTAQDPYRAPPQRAETATAEGTFRAALVQVTAPDPGGTRFRLRALRRVDPDDETPPARPSGAPRPPVSERLRLPVDADSRRLFHQRLVPLLRQLGVEELAKATGLSLSYCTRIRNGRCLPHRRHWSILVDAVTRETDGCGFEAAVRQTSDVPSISDNSFQIGTQHRS